MQPASLRFAAASRALASAAHTAGLVVPSFRSPPRRPGTVRTIRREAGGAITIAVARRDRPWSAVLADLIEGVVVANDLDPPSAATWRTEAWLALERDVRAQAA
jgi:hypothetical protein